MPVFDDDPFGGVKSDQRSDTPPPREVSNFHDKSDVDATVFAHHHTLGIKHNQAAPGDHTHNGRDSKPLSANLMGSGIGQFAFMRTLSNSAPVNNSTVYIATALSMAVVANAAYVVECYFRGTANTVAGWKVMFAGPAAATFSLTQVGVVTTDAAVSGSYIAQARGFGQDITYPGAGVATETVGRPTGLLLVGANAGNLTVSFTQRTADPTDAIFRANSWIRMQRVE